jgi:hypothetical protein
VDGYLSGRTKPQTDCHNEQLWGGNDVGELQIMYDEKVVMVPGSRKVVMSRGDDDNDDDDDNTDGE